MTQNPDLRPILAAVNPEEAIAFFRQKGFRIGFDYRDVWRQEHQAAFTVAKAMQIDLLKDIRESVDEAIASGSTLADFQKALTPKLQARGWWGRQAQVDPKDGVAKEVQLGSLKRLETIYDTNLATAYSEGQWERIQRNQALFPFLEYVRSASVNPRHTHLAYAGLVLRADDAFWQTHLPIKEWGCKCSVIQHTQRMLDAEGLQLGQAPPEVMRTLVNKRTGETMQVPVGVDPAFHYPPGGRRGNLGRMMMDKAETASAATAARVLGSGRERWMPAVQSEFQEFVGRYAAGEHRELGARRVVGVLSPEVLARLAAAGVVPERATVAASLQKLHHLLGDGRSPVRQAKGSGVAFVSSLPRALQEAGEMWLDTSRGRSDVMWLAASDEPGQVVKIVATLDAREKGRLENAVVSMERVPSRDVQRRGLTWLGGEIEALR